MTKLSDLGRPLIGHRHEGPPASELAHFLPCPVCGQQIDMRDFRQVTPIRAAREATERDVTLRTSEPIWIRVADEKRGHIFEYSFSL